jgi:hypothetical protein
MAKWVNNNNNRNNRLVINNSKLVGINWRIYLNMIWKHFKKMTLNLRIYLTLVIMKMTNISNNMTYKEIEKNIINRSNNNKIILINMEKLKIN